MTAVPDALRAEVTRELRNAGARFALLHGSRSAGSHRPDSDLDVAVWWAHGAPPSFEVLLPAGVDLVVLNDAPLELAGRIAMHGQIISTTTRPDGFTGSLPPARSTPTSSRGYVAGIVSSSGASGVVDEVRVLRLLRLVTDELAVLRGEASADARRRADALWLRGVKYTFVTVIEACVDVAQHICASEGVVAQAVRL